MKPRSGPGSALIGCLILGTLGGCADGFSSLHPPAPVEAPSLVSGNSDLEALPLREPLIPPNFEDFPVDELLATPMLRDSSFMEEVQEWVGFWTTSASSWFPDYLRRMKWFEGTVDSTLALHDLPQSLRYLPVIESGYSPVAVSRANAVGLWQFMAPTAKGLGMEVTALVDERRDPLRSTEAAAVFLGELYEEF
ncbi:MAG: transglycosylase SLT domain-containing protein, partial [bacterium]